MNCISINKLEWINHFLLAVLAIPSLNLFSLKKAKVVFLKTLNTASFLSPQYNFLA